MSKYKIISGPYFPAFKLNSGIWVNLRMQPNKRKYRPEKASYFDAFHATESLPTKSSGIVDKIFPFAVASKISLASPFSKFKRHKKV